MSVFSEKVPLAIRRFRKPSIPADAIAKKEELRLIIKAIGDAFQYNKYIEQDELKEREYLNVNKLLTEEDPGGPLYAAGMALSNFTQTQLIDDQGQHSDLYYDLQRLGVEFVVTERDSFGPLGVRMRYPGVQWWVTYG